MVGDELVDCCRGATDGEALAPVILGGVVLVLCCRGCSALAEVDGFAGWIGGILLRSEQREDNCFELQRPQKSTQGRINTQGRM